MKIRIHSYYRSANGVRLEAGDYAIDDPRLKGCGQKLVDATIASVVGDSGEPAIEVDSDYEPVFTIAEYPSAQDVVISLEAMTKAELRTRIVNVLDIIPSTSLTKKELIAMLGGGES